MQYPQKYLINDSVKNIQQFKKKKMHYLILKIKSPSFLKRIN